MNQIESCLILGGGGHARMLIEILMINEKKFISSAFWIRTQNLLEKQSREYQYSEEMNCYQN